jgi:alcohol dehydrogenase (NADP+)
MASKTPTVKLNTGATIPQLGFGTWRLTEGADESVYNAIKLGYRHIDCATAYDNQDQVGKGFQRAFQEGLVKREDLFVTSKLWNKEHGEVDAALKRVLKDLQLEYLDLYLVHWPVNMTQKEGTHLEPPMSQTWKQLEEQVDAGQTRAIGISNFSIKKMEELLQKTRITPAMLQIESHCYFRNQELIDAAHAHDIAVTAYSPLGSKSPEGETSPLEDEKVQEIAKKLKLNPAQVLLKWALQREPPIVVIPKATSEDHIKANLEVLDLDPLPKEDVEALNSLKTQRRSVPASMWTNEKGPYKTEASIWEEGFPGGSV